MQRQIQEHRLKETWEAQDHAVQAQYSAKSAQQYHQLIARQAGVIDAQFAEFRQLIEFQDQKIEFLERKVKRQDNDFNANRNTCLMWGCGGAVITSIVMSLVLTPFQPPSPQLQQSTHQLKVRR